MHSFVRRSLIGSVSIAATMALVLTGCAGSEEAGGTDTTLTIVTYGGSTAEGIQKTLADPFTEKTGIATNVTEPVDYGKYTAMIENDQVTWDWVSLGASYILQHPDFWATPPDTVPTIASDDVITLPGNVPSDDRLVPNGSYSFNIAYRTDAEGAHPTNWEEFFDTTAISGKRAVLNDPFGMLEAALLGDGVAYEDLYPLDVPRALAKLDSVRDDLVFWSSGAELQQLLTSGEVDYAFAWNNRVADIARSGAPVALEWNGALQDASYMVTSENNPRVDETMEFFAFSLEPEVQAAYAEATGFSPATYSALELMPEESLEWLNVYEPNLSKAAGTIDVDYWAENYDAVLAEWTSWASS